MVVVLGNGWVIMKTCTKCNMLLSIGAFHRRRKSKDGLRSSCKECDRQTSVAYYAANKDKCSVRCAEWYKKNSEIAKTTARNWQKANPEQYKKNKIRWDAAHVDVIRAKQTKWHLKHPEYATIYRAEWYKINANKEKANVAKWRKANPGKVNATNAKRRAAKLNATPLWLTKEQLLEIQSYYGTAKELQWLSEEPLEIDHIVPLQGENVSGLHVPWNLQILPESLNCSKGNKYGP